VLRVSLKMGSAALRTCCNLSGGFLFVLLAWSAAFCAVGMLPAQVYSAARPRVFKVSGCHRSEAFKYGLCHEFKI